MIPVLLPRLRRPLKKQDLTTDIDISLYLNRWIAIVRGRVVGVGLTARQAYHAAKRTRPKDKPAILFVAADGKVEEANEMGEGG